MVTAELRRNYAGVFDGRLGFGRRPAILVVDLVRAYTTAGAPLYAPDVVGAAARTADLLQLGRSRGVPVIYTRVLYSDGGVDGGLFVRKVPVLRSFVAGEVLTEIDPVVAPQPGELIIVKQYASAFFGTTLAPTLTAAGVDTLIVAGCSTSGCIRATVVDGMQHGFRMVVPRECVGDRARGPHEANLFDIDSKYGDAVSIDDVADYLHDLDRKAGAA